MRWTLFLLLAACSEYSINGPRKEAPAPEEEEPEPEPEPDPEPIRVPDIAVTPASLDFGALPKDCAATPKEVTLTNEGDGPLTVSEIELSGSGFSAFSTDWNGAPFTLEPGEARTVQVGFTPNAWVSYAITLTVRSDDPDESVVDLPTTGIGDVDSTYEQRFTQGYFEAVDILWVVDNSGSMEEETYQVTSNFSVFIDAFVDLGLSYHIGVVTTDMDDPSQSGRLRGPVITEASADPSAEFLAQIDAGFTGSADERGFDAVRAALTEPLLSTTSAGFLREDAALAVIVLSDENDYSSMSPSNFVTWYDTLKADPAKLSFNAICGDRFFGCTNFDSFGNPLSATGGDEYIDAVGLTSGYFGSICTADYSEILDHISLSSAGMTLSFALDHEPSDLGAVVVTVNGVEIENDQYEGWTWEASTASVVFHGGAVPPPGAEVVVTYPIPTECSG